jgi:hypothetical protein
MLIEDNRKRTDLAPRQDIPDGWAASGCCPACAAAPLKLVHLKGSPDFLLCPRCELSFEVEQSAGLIRLKNIPDQLGFAEAELQHRWLQPPALRKLLENRGALMQQNTFAVPVQPLSDDEIWNRSLGLFRLGNKPRMIEFMLIQAGATHEQAETALVRLKNWAEQDAQSQNNRLLVVGIITILIIAVLIGGSWLFASSSLAAQLNQSRSKPALAKQPVLPVEILKAIPDGLKPEFLKSAPASVDKTGPNRAGCPSQSMDAAALFGGDSKAWQPGSQNDSWQMMSMGKPATIRIPRGMYAGFIDNTTFVFTQADGPSTIHNVNFVVIMCN